MKIVTDLDNQFTFLENGIEIGHIEMDSDTELGLLYIESKFRNQGFYRKILKELILSEVYEYDFLVSHNRNEDANDIYCHFLNKSDLDYNDDVTIEVEDDKLTFNIY